MPPTRVYLERARKPPAGRGSITGVGSLMLLDTASLYYRAFYGMPETVTAPDGTPVNAIRGLLDAMARLVREHQPARLVACLDADWRPAFRTAAIPGYKLHRAEPDGSEQTPPGLAVQVPLITQVLIAAGIALAEHDGYEADDVIATLAAKATQPVDVVTGDRDLFQLVDDERQVRVLYTIKGLGKLDPITQAEVGKKYDIPGDRYADFAVLRGDPSDGLPGVPGIGEKTAAALIRAFGDLDNLKNALDKGYGGFPTGTRKKLEAARSYLDVAPPVVRTATDVPLPDDIDGALPAVPPDPDLLTEIGAELGLGSSLSRFRAAVTSTSSPRRPLWLAASRTDRAGAGGNSSRTTSCSAWPRPMTLRPRATPSGRSAKTLMSAPRGGTLHPTSLDSPIQAWITARSAQR